VKRLALVAVRIADDHVVAPDHDAPGVVLIIHDGVGAASDDGGGDSRAVAEMPRRQNVGGSQEIGEAVDDRFILPSRAVPGDDGLRTVNLFVMEDSFRNGIQGLVPGDPFPFSAPLGADPANRMGQPVRVIDQLCGSDTL
jgi:hypothetical protein